MNVERPSYHQRDFYGPLELSEMHEQGSDRYMMVHPDDTTKMVRASSEHDYSSREEMLSIIHDTEQVLLELREHGIATVNPTYIDETSSDGTPYLITVVDKLETAKPFDRLLAKKKLDPEFVDEADQVICRLLDYTRKVELHGGYIDPEMMQLNQFVYDDTRAPGQKMVLVDVEPIGATHVPPGIESIQNRIPSPPVVIVASLCMDLVRLAKKTDQPLESIHAILRVIDALPGKSEETQTAKEALRTAILTKKADKRIANLAWAEPMDLDIAV